MDITVLLMILDILIIFAVGLSIVRFMRVIFMRIKLICKIRSICKDQNYEIRIYRSPLSSIFYKSGKIDMSIKTPDEIYHIKFIASFSSKKVYHFVDENNFVTYYKTFFALPMARKSSEFISLASYHRFPKLETKIAERENEKYVFLFNPLPNDITYIDNKGTKQIAGNGSMIGSLYVYNGKGFCSCINKGTVTP